MKCYGKQWPWRKALESELEPDISEALSMQQALKALGHSPAALLNDFSHCRFFHGSGPRWYSFCRTHFEENYCVYEFMPVCLEGQTDTGAHLHEHDHEDHGQPTFRRRCSLYVRYHRDKADMNALAVRRECFRIDAASAGDGTDVAEIAEAVVLQLCDTAHCFVFHSASEPRLAEFLATDSPFEHSPALTSTASALTPLRERNQLDGDQFELEMRGDSNVYDAESFGVLLSFKDDSYASQSRSMREELLRVLSEPQYLETHSARLSSLKRSSARK